MKAVILAGQDGERLYPLNEETPLLLMPVLSKPILEYLLEQCGRCGVTECIVAAGPMQAMFSEYLKTRTSDGIKIFLAGIQRRDGTAGAVKSVLYGDGAEETLIITEDVFFQEDLTEVIQRHRERGSQMTKIMKRGRGADGLAYLLNPMALELAPDEPFELDALFCRLKEVRRRTDVYYVEDRWIRIHNPQEYCACQYSHITNSNKVFVGEQVFIGNDVHIEGPCVIGDYAAVCDGARIYGGVLGKGAYIGKNVVVRQAVVGDNAAIQSGAVLLNGCLIGNGAVIGEREVIRTGVCVLPNRKPNAGFTANWSGEFGAELNPETLSRLGRAIGAAFGPGTVAAACSDNDHVNCLKMALISGILSAGASVKDMGRTFAAQFRFCLTFAAIPLGVFIDCHEGKGRICFWGSDANQYTMEIKRRFICGGFPPHGARCGSYTLQRGMEMLYMLELIRCAPFGLEGTCARIQSKNQQLKAMLEETLTKLGCDISQGPVLLLDEDGMNLHTEFGPSNDIVNETDALMGAIRMLAQRNCSAITQQRKDLTFC